jgi:hypothetical protein
MPYDDLYRFLGFWEEGIEGEFLREEEDLMAEKSAISLVRTRVPFLELRNSKLPLTMPLMLF